MLLQLADGFLRIPPRFGTSSRRYIVTFCYKGSLISGSKTAIDCLNPIIAGEFRHPLSPPLWPSVHSLPFAFGWVLERRLPSLPPVFLNLVKNETFTGPIGLCGRVVTFKCVNLPFETFFVNKSPVLVLNFLELLASIPLCFL